MELGLQLTNQLKEQLMVLDAKANTYTPFVLELKKNSRNFRMSREMREKICVIRPYFGRIFDENAVETQNRALPKFQILVPKSKSEFEI